MARGSNAARPPRALRDHAHKKDVEKQKRHLASIKSAAELRRIVLGGRGLR